MLRFFGEEKTELVALPIVMQPRGLKGVEHTVRAHHVCRVETLRIALFIVNGEDGPPKQLASYFKDQRDVFIFGPTLSHQVAPCSVEVPRSLYHSAHSVLSSIEVLSVALDIHEEPVIRLAETLTSGLVPSRWVSQQEAFQWTAMTTDHFPLHLRDFEWDRNCASLTTKDRLERWGHILSARCANCGSSPEATEHVVQDCH